MVNSSFILTIFERLLRFIYLKKIHSTVLVKENAFQVLLYGLQQQAALTKRGPATMNKES